MAVNLETLLPQAFPHTAPPLVPSNSGGEEALFGGDVFSPASMYGSDAMSLLPGSDPLDFDPSLLKSDEYLELCGSQYVETLYRTSDSNDTFNEWMTTPIPLPITPPEDPLSGTNSITNSTPTLHTYTPSHAYTPSSAYTVTPTFSYHAPPSPVPLTPESLVSPDSFCNSEEVDEVLSYFSSDSSRSPMASNDAFNVFPSTSSAGTPFPASQIYSDSGSPTSSMHSSYASLSSSPSSSSPATPLSISPAPSPLHPTSLTLLPIMPGDTIRNMLAQNHTHIPTSSDTSSELELSPDALVKRTNLQKRKFHESTTSEPACKKQASSGCGQSGRGRKRAGSKKERKREQNKTAALRYRQKKKFEKVDFDAQQKVLEERNGELKATIGSMEAEISYLKQLWSEVAHAKEMRCRQ